MNLEINAYLGKSPIVRLYSPAAKSLVKFFAISSATKEVATLRRGILNNLDTILKIDIETPAEASSTEPVEAKRVINPSLDNNHQIYERKPINYTVNQQHDKKL